jgi:hypothetical protein
MKVKVSIALEADILSRIDRLAKVIGVTRSAYIQKMLDSNLNRDEGVISTVDVEKARWMFRNGGFGQVFGDPIEAWREASDEERGKWPGAKAKAREMRKKGK